MLQFRRYSFQTVIALALFLIAGRAFAAPLTFSTAENVTLTSPATTLTIATGSLADDLQVNATSVIVSLSSSTGGSFTLISPSFGLTIASSSAGGAVTTSCISGIASTTITQSSGETSYTITPTGSECFAQQPNSGSSNGPTIAVASQYGLPYVPGVGIIATSTTSSEGASAQTSTVAGTSSSTALETHLNSLLALLAELEAEAQARGIAVPASLSSGSASPPFGRNLHIGMSGSDVAELQRFLSEDAALYPQGEITSYFGPLTKNAVERFQSKYGIAKPANSAYGTVGPATRGKLNSLIKQGIAP